MAVITNYLELLSLVSLLGLSISLSLSLSLLFTRPLSLSLSLISYFQLGIHNCFVYFAMNSCKCSFQLHFKIELHPKQPCASLTKTLEKMEKSDNKNRIASLIAFSFGLGENAREQPPSQPQKSVWTPYFGGCKMHNCCWYKHNMLPEF